MTLETRAKHLSHSLQALIEGAEKADLTSTNLPADLSAQEVRVLRTVGCMDCPIMSAIAGAIRLSLSSVTGLIDRLCEKRLVTRDRSEDDRRIVQVELTEQGRQLHEAALEGRLRFAKDVLQTLGSQEQETFVALVQKISKQLKDGRNS